MLIAAVAVALLASLVYAAGSVAQQKVASSVPTEEAGGAKLFARLLRQPLYVVGVLGDGVGFALQAVALGLGSLALVQPLLVTSLLFALPLSAAWAGRRLRPADGLWALLLTGGLAVFVVAGDPTEGADFAPLGDWLLAAIVLTPIIAACLVGARVSRANRAVLLGVVTGIMFGVTAALTKSVVALVGTGDIGRIVTSWELYALAAAGLASFVVQAQAFQAGDLQSSMPVMTVLDPIVATALGVAILSEEIQVAGAEWLLIGVAVVAMIVGTVALARNAGALENAPAGSSAAS